MSDKEALEDFLQGNSKHDYDGGFDGGIIAVLVTAILTLLFICYKCAKILVLLPGVLSKNKRIAFDAIFLTIVGFALEFGVITWDFTRLTQFTRGDWKLWPQSLGLPAGRGRVQELTQIFRLSFDTEVNQL